jgi:hypothetical protein
MNELGEARQRRRLILHGGQSGPKVGSVVTSFLRGAVQSRPACLAN